ncbi:cystathionine gamma-synthase family protein [Alteromonadaceae bacterium M269]|nr:cystathionine gamma-synthase family protein [Alteromonadaceae bacterium M269]
MTTKGFTTRLVHADRLLNKPQDGAVHQATTNSVLFEYEDVNDLVDVFQGRKVGHVYSRSSSTSNAALQNMLANIEGGTGALVFSTGMAAISSTLLSLLKAGDHIIMSQYLFGNSASLAETIEDLGIRVCLVDVTDVSEVERAISEETKVVYLETIANPVTQVADLARIGELCQSRGLLYIVDNTMTPSCLFTGSQIKASLLVGSLTKYYGGHGNVLGGFVIDTGIYDWSSYANISDFYKTAPVDQWGVTQVKKKGLRDMGATLSPQSAHMVSVGMETLELRMKKTCENAMVLANFLEQHDKVEKVYYPGLASHPQHDLAQTHFSDFGGILSIDLKPECDCFDFLNALSLIIKATHLGDTRTLALPVAHTIFYENGPEKRAQMGINDNMIRFSIGIENSEDLIYDLTQALEKV